MLQIEENKDLTKLSTFRMQAQAAYFAEITDKNDIQPALLFASKQGVPVVVIGGGSNTIFTQPYMQALVLMIAIPGFEVIAEDNHTVVIQCGAGEVWDSVVDRTVAMNLSGMEALSAIPGFVGGTPVQNVGAYGQEVKDTIVTVEAFDRKKQRFVVLANRECKFGYRDSIFKNEEKGRYIIVSVDFILSKQPARVPQYPGVTAYFEAHDIHEPTLAQIRQVIIAIRKNKLPDPQEIASVGSFFKNPFIPVEQGNKLKAEFDNAVIFPVDEATVKVGAGWMLETLGYRGKDFGTLMCYPGNAMVIVNKGTATSHELRTLVARIQRNVLEKFGVAIEPEPIFVE